MRTLSSETYYFYYMPLATNTSNDIKIVPTPTHVPAARAAGMQRKLPSLSSAFPSKRKSVSRTRTGFLLHFLSRRCKLRFAVCICTCEENEGLQREHPFAAGFPIGARAALLAHDFALQSLVCYTFASG